LVLTGTACASSGEGLPSAHVHGVDVNPADGRVYLATHDGLFRYGDAGPERVGPHIDLMGFTVAGADHFYSSGHPGPGTALPDPVGLIESTDAGRTWRALSRQGGSDFHALAASSAGVVGFDGALRVSADGKAWQDVAVPAPPYSLAAAPDGKAVLGTTEAGLMRSVDGGHTWTGVPGAPLLGLVDWAAGDTIAGVGTDGTVFVSTDTGLTWQRRATVPAQPQALGAATAGDGRLRILVVTDDAVLQSSDGGATFSPLPRGSA
jgi:photosystem II stability/assembly factor-like uncharacterized protein